MLNISIPDTASIEVIADWVELKIAYEKSSLSKAQLSSYIEGSSGSEPSESDIDSVWLELSAREMLYGEKPPFNVNTRSVHSRINWERRPDYLACLIFALFGNPNAETSAASAGKLFEMLSNEAVRNYFNGKSIVYGFPSDLTLEQIALQMNEKYQNDPPSNRKDRNIDIFAWKSFEDSRASQLTVVLQCAAGQNWKSKLKEINLEIWRQYICFASAPIKGFCVPVIIRNETQLLEHSFDAGIIFDRARIYRYVINRLLQNPLKNNAKEWCYKRISELS